MQRGWQKQNTIITTLILRLVSHKGIHCNSAYSMNLIIVCIVTILKLKDSASITPRHYFLQ